MRRQRRRAVAASKLEMRKRCAGAVRCVAKPCVRNLSPTSLRSSHETSPCQWRARDIPILRIPQLYATSPSAYLPPGHPTPAHLNSPATQLSCPGTSRRLLFFILLQHVYPQLWLPFNSPSRDIRVQPRLLRWDAQQTSRTGRRQMQHEQRHRAAGHRARRAVLLAAGLSGGWVRV